MKQDIGREFRTYRTILVGTYIILSILLGVSEVWRGGAWDANLISTEQLTDFWQRKRQFFQASSLYVAVFVTFFHLFSRIFLNQKLKQNNKVLSTEKMDSWIFTIYIWWITGLAITGIFTWTGGQTEAMIALLFFVFMLVLNLVRYIVFVKNIDRYIMDKPVKQ